MNFITEKARQRQMIQVAFVLFLICSVINPVENIQQAEMPVVVQEIDTISTDTITAPDTILKVTAPPVETIIETGINQSQTSKRKKVLPKPDKETSRDTFVVPTHLQAENLLDQGYSVKDIAQELGMDKKEVRKLKRKQRKEERTALARRKKEAKAISQ